MRIISQQAMEHFYSDTPCVCENTTITIQGDETQLRFFGTLIAKRNPNGLYIRSAGGATPTIADRLNAILSRQDCYVYIKDNIMFLNNKKDITEWIQCNEC